MPKAVRQLERLRDNILAGLEGSAATLRLVIDEALVNELVAESVTSRYPALRELRLTFEADNQVSVLARSTKPLMPKVTLHCEIERVAILDPSAIVRVRILKRGFSQIVSALLPTMADRLPPDVKVSGDYLELDLATLLDRWNLSWILPMVVHLEVETFTGQVQVALDLRA
jgi:hypothetical protein